MLSVVRIPDAMRDLVAAGEQALRVLAACPGYLRGRLARATDADGGWVLVTEWATVGAWRRALSSYEVKLRATELLALALDEPSAFEVLVAVEAGGEPQRFDSDRADTPGRRDAAADR